MAALIQFASGAPGIKYALERRLISIGRGSEGNDICLPCSFASKHHAMIELVENSLNPGSYDIYLEDMDSRNHTYVNGEVIDRVKLEDGDIIRIGRNTLKFDASGSMPNLETVQVDYELPFHHQADTKPLPDTDNQSQTWNFSRRLSLITSGDE